MHRQRRSALFSLKTGRCATTWVARRNAYTTRCYTVYICTLAIPWPAIWLDPQRGSVSVTFTFRWRFGLSVVPCCSCRSNVGRHGWLPGPLIHTPEGKSVQSYWLLHTPVRRPPPPASPTPTAHLNSAQLDSICRLYWHQSKTFFFCLACLIGKIIRFLFGPFKHSSLLRVCWFFTLITDSAAWSEKSVPYQACKVGRCVDRLQVYSMDFTSKWLKRLRRPNKCLRGPTRRFARTANSRVTDSKLSRRVIQ